MTYCTDIDLLEYRPNILSLGVLEWSNQRENAYSMINRTLESKWYRQAAIELNVDYLEISFDPTLVEAGTLTRLECFKTLELIYMYLKKDSQQSDGFARLEQEFRQRYNEELTTVLGVGLTYDWDQSGDITYDERFITSPRRLHRA